MRSHISGVTCEPHCYHAPSARRMCVCDTSLYVTGRTAIIMLKILRTTIQNVFNLGELAPGIPPGGHSIQDLCRIKSTPVTSTIFWELSSEQSFVRLQYAQCALQDLNLGGLLGIISVRCVWWGLAEGSLLGNSNVQLTVRTLSSIITANTLSSVVDMWTQRRQLVCTDWTGLDWTGLTVPKKCDSNNIPTQLAVSPPLLVQRWEGAFMIKVTNF